jgi:hypothetical protein
MKRRAEFGRVNMPMEAARDCAHCSRRHNQSNLQQKPSSIYSRVGWIIGKGFRLKWRRYASAYVTPLTWLTSRGSQHSLPGWNRRESNDQNRRQVYSKIVMMMQAHSHRSRFYSISHYWQDVNVSDDVSAPPPPSVEVLCAVLCVTKPKIPPIYTRVTKCRNVQVTMESADGWVQEGHI